MIGRLMGVSILFVSPLFFAPILVVFLLRLRRKGRGGKMEERMRREEGRLMRNG